MGADVYRHLVPYQSRAQKALDELREDVFRRREYDGASDEHQSIDDALDDGADETGTSSVLDIQFLSSESELGCASELSDADLERYFGTTRPTVSQIDGCNAFWNSVERGTARVLVIYEGEHPAQLYFVGYTLD